MTRSTLTLLCFGHPAKQDTLGSKVKRLFGYEINVERLQSYEISCVDYHFFSAFCYHSTCTLARQLWLTLSSCGDEARKRQCKQANDSSMKTDHPYHRSQRVNNFYPTVFFAKNGQISYHLRSWKKQWFRYTIYNQRGQIESLKKYCTFMNSRGQI